MPLPARTRGGGGDYARKRQKKRGRAPLPRGKR
jgi:hypothetical protein